ncbi:geranylgeranyl pyrophosphate synthetase [Schaereria dolodes]|nr:geranylgeranyl pyrophosphate synthetase [Schaereria dolodes]
MSNGTQISDGKGWSQEKEKILLGPYDYMFEQPGKNIRKQFIIAFNAWLKVPEETLAIITKVVGMLHTASLLVDDVEDSSLLRRGIPVTHSIFGTAQTLNSANYVYFCALQDLLKLNNAKAIQIYSEELCNLHRGQGMDLFWRDTLTCPTEDDYLEMVANKTGGLFRLAVKLMQAESKTKKDCVPLVNLIGLIFQIRDDYMNLSSTEYTNNKGLCEDLTEGKFSFPIIHSIRSNPQNLQLINILRQRSNEEQVKRYAVSYMEGTGSFAYCKKVLSELIEKAMNMVEMVDEGKEEAAGMYIYCYLLLHTKRLNLSETSSASAPYTPVPAIIPIELDEPIPVKTEDDWVIADPPRPAFPVEIFGKTPDTQRRVFPRLSPIISRDVTPTPRILSTQRTPPRELTPGLKPPEISRTATRLVRPGLRRQLVLVGGAASTAHSSVFYTEDVDVAAPPSVLIQILEAVSAGAPNFSLESDGKIAFDAPQRFRVRIDLIQIGNECIERIHVVEPFHEGSLTSTSDFLRLRAVTVVDRGSDGEVDDFRWLLSGVAGEGQNKVLDQEELEYMGKAGKSCLGRIPTAKKAKPIQPAGPIHLTPLQISSDDDDASDDETESVVESPGEVTGFLVDEASASEREVSEVPRSLEEQLDDIRNDYRRQVGEHDFTKLMWDEKVTALVLAAERVDALVSIFS